MSRAPPGATSEAAPSSSLLPYHSPKAKQCPAVHRVREINAEVRGLALRAEREHHTEVESCLSVIAEPLREPATVVRSRWRRA